MHQSGGGRRRSKAPVDSGGVCVCSMLVPRDEIEKKEVGHSVELADLVVQNPHDVLALPDEDGAESELCEHVGGVDRAADGRDLDHAVLLVEFGKVLEIYVKNKIININQYLYRK